MAHPDVYNEGISLQIWRVAANVFNKQQGVAV
jgi:hypothetical protein